ncbi:MAG: tol-pal system YbgF family protein [Rhodothermales bacterium]
MSTLTPPKSISKRQELRQDKVVTVYAKVWEFFDANRLLVYGILGVLTLVLAGIIGYALLQTQRADKAQELLGTIVGVYEKGEYREALDGNETTFGLLTIAEDYSSTQAGNLAQFYAADALFRLGEYDQALELFEAFDKEDNLVGASAYAGEAAIHELKENYEQAGDLYRRAAIQFENELTSPDYLLAAGRAYEAAGAFAQARNAYVMIEEQYPESTQAANVEFLLSRLEARSQ